MPTRPPVHRPPGWRPATKAPDPAHRRYHTREWRAVREVVIRRDGGRCVQCGEPGRIVDHIVAVKDGGSDAPSNLRLLCARCDNRRHTDKGRWERR